MIFNLLWFGLGFIVGIAAIIFFLAYFFDEIAGESPEE